MSKINDGGPAYPHTASDGHPDYRSGMALRDWFAGQALARLIGSSGLHRGEPEPEMCERAYSVAVAMIAARTKGGDADG